MIRRFALFAAPLFIASALAGTNEWTPTGPPGAALANVAYVNATGTALATSPRRIYRTTNDGTSWSEVFGRPYPGQAQLLAVNPANGNQAVAILDVVVRSTDGGATWTTVATPGLPLTPNGEQPRSIAWTRDGSVLWVGTSNGVLYRSTNAGQTFTASGTTGTTSEIRRIDVDAADANRVYALASTSLLVTSNGGTNWNSLGGSWNELAASRAQAGVVLAAPTGTAQVWRSIDYGATFASVSTQQVGRLRFAPAPANVVYSVGYGEFFFSTDLGSTWTSRPAVPDRNVGDFAIRASGSHRLMVATGSGVFGSSDGAISWTALRTGMQELPHSGLIWRQPPGNAGELWVYGWSPEAIYKRLVNGNWVAIGPTDGPMYEPGTGFSFAVAPGDGTMYMARYQHFGTGGTGGAIWSEVGSLDAIGELTVDPRNERIVYATDRNFRKAKTLNGGANWDPIGATDLPAAIASFVISAESSSRVYALAGNQSVPTGYVLFVSEDSGTTWAPMQTTPTAMNNSPGRLLIQQPGSPGTMYVSLDAGLFKTTDAGVTWTQLHPYPENTTGLGDRVSAVSIDPAVPTTLYVSTDWAYAAKRSIDGGANWEPLRAAVAGDEKLIDQLVIDPNRPDTVVGINVYGGLFELTIAPDLAVTSAGTLTAGTPSTGSLTITNNGPYTATMVHLSATLAAATGAYTLLPTPGAECGVVITQLVCDVAVLRPASSLTVTFGFTPAAAGTSQASVAARESDSSATNNTLTLSVVAASTGGGNNGGGGGSSGGGGGGGRLDYLLLAFLFFTMLSRTASLRRRFPTCASTLRKH